MVLRRWVSQAPRAAAAAAAPRTAPPPHRRAARCQQRWSGMGISNASRYGEMSKGGGGLKTKYYEDPDVPVPLLHTCTKRVKYLQRTIKFYTDVFDFEVLHSVKVMNSGYSLIFVGPRMPNLFEPARMKVNHGQMRTRNPHSEDARPIPGSLDAHDYLFHYHSTCLEFIHFTNEEHNHHYKISSGNDPKALGYGGINVMVEDLAYTCRRLHVLKHEVLAEPTPEDPSVLVLDPDGYAVRITERKSTTMYDMRMRPDPNRMAAVGMNAVPMVSAKPPQSVLNQIRLRVKNPRAAVPFYEEFFNMIVVCVREHPELNLTRYYMACHQQLRLESVGLLPIPKDPRSEEAWEFVQSFRVAFLELQHHHGVEDAEGFQYHSGNTPPLGFGHLGFLVADVENIIEKAVEMGIFVIKNKGEGAFPQTAYIMDPDGYWIEIYPRCMRDFIIKQDDDSHVPERWGT